MSLAPLAAAPFAVQFHVATVVAAALVGMVVFLNRKGTPFHRVFGRLWMFLMVSTAVSTFFIHTFSGFHGFSPIHLLSVFTICGCAQAVYFARRGDIRRHMRVVKIVYVGGIVIAGGFTFVPGRIMHAILFENGAYNVATATLLAVIFCFLLLSALRPANRSA